MGASDKFHCQCQSGSYRRMHHHHPIATLYCYIITCYNHHYNQYTIHSAEKNSNVFRNNPPLHQTTIPSPPLVYFTLLWQWSSSSHYRQAYCIKLLIRINHQSVYRVHSGQRKQKMANNYRGLHYWQK